MDARLTYLPCKLEVTTELCLCKSESYPIAECKNRYGKMETITLLGSVSLCIASCVSFCPFRVARDFEFLFLLVFLTKSEKCKIYIIKPLSGW